MLNSTLKYFGILAILPLLTVALTIDYSSEADGSKAVGPKGAKSYGAKNSGKVCGDRLCSESAPAGQASSASRESQVPVKRIEPVSEDVIEERLAEKETQVPQGEMMEEMMEKMEPMMKPKEMMDTPSEKTSMQMKTQTKQDDGVGLELSVPQTIIAKKLLPINARVFDTALDANLSHTDWSYAVTNSDGHIIHKTTTLHGHMGIMNFKESFPESGTYTITYSILSSGSYMLGAPVPELGQTRSLVTGDLMRFEEDPKNNFGSRTFEFTVTVSDPEQTVIIEGSNPGTAYLVNLYTQPARVIAGEPVTIILDIDDFNTGKDATHIDGLISIIPQNYYQSASGDQPDAPMVLFGGYHGHLGLMSTTQIFPKSGTVILEVELKTVPYSIPPFGHGSTQFEFQVFDSADTFTVRMEEPAKENTVDIVGLESPFYMPNTITVSAGETIVFDNVDPNYHTVTSVKPGTIEHDGKFDSGLLNAGESYELTIDEQGTYDYFCSLHIGMKGTIIVS